MEAELRKITGVSHLLIRVNDEDTTVDGVPGHTIAAYVNGGNAGLVASAIWRKKPPGIGTCGTVSRTVTDEQGNSHTVKFSRPTLLSISFRIELRSYSGFDEAAVTAAMRSVLMTYINETMDIGEALNIPQLYGLLYRAAGSYASTFAVTDLSCSGAHGVEREKLTPAWNAKFTLSSGTSVTVIVNS